VGVAAAFAGVAVVVLAVVLRWWLGWGGWRCCWLLLLLLLPVGGFVVVVVVAVGVSGLLLGYVGFADKHEEGQRTRLEPQVGTYVVAVRCDVCCVVLVVFCIYSRRTDKPWLLDG
jgi:hypothetical protein